MSNAPDPLLMSGLTHHQTGRLAEAEKIYRTLLADNPRQSDAMHLLGLIARQTGDHAAAADWIRRAIAIAPNQATYHCNLGMVLNELGQNEQAIFEFQTALELRPDYPEAHNNLGNALRAKKMLAEAVEAYQHAVRIKPEFAEAHYNLGIALEQQGQLGLARDAYATAIRLKPQYAYAHTNLGNVLANQGMALEAISEYSHAISLRPDLPEPLNAMGNALRDLGRLDEAVDAYQRAITINPRYTEAISNLAGVLQVQGKLDAAVALFRQAVHDAGNSNEQKGKILNNLAGTLKDMGRIDEALALYDQAIAMNPADGAAHSNRLYCQHFHPASDPAAIYSEHVRWNSIHAAPLEKPIMFGGRNSDTNRRLRIGYISPDFRDHPVGRFILPLLENHSRENFEIFGYSDARVANGVGDRIRQACSTWRHIAGIPDEKVAEVIRADAVDILVDLAGHTGGNRLLVFARRPAPVQVTYLGYPDTTGMRAIDYRLTDYHSDPPGMTELYHSEQLSRLPDTFLCTTCIGEALLVAPSPADSRGHITYGCMNTLPKINRPLIEMWAGILQKTRRSRLLLKAKAFATESVRQSIADIFGEYGIDADRLTLQPWSNSFGDHLKTYHDIDVALDTFPYHGTATTCEALWMGVPVVSLAGKSHVSRAGATLLINAGLSDFLAQHPQEYIDIAVRAADDVAMLNKTRRQIRDRLLASPLMDVPRFARNVERAYRQMWQTWCATH